MVALLPLSIDPAPILERFTNVLKRGDKWSAKCPVHEDNRNSLSVWIGRNGKILVGCHAGCDKKEILRAVGLTFADLAGGRANTQPQVQRRILKTYDYRDEFGDVLYQTVRYDPKDFRQRQPLPGGGWQWNLDGARRVLYRLPDLLRVKESTRKCDRVVFIVEGEKDADNLWSIGIPATTRVCGARSPWQRDWSEVLRGCTCVIVPDNDKPGHDSAATIAGNLVIAGTGWVQVLQLAGVGIKGDVSDWIASQRASDSTADQTREQLLGLAFNSMIYITTSKWRV